MTEPCSVEGCDNPKLWRGMCRAHYERWRRSRPGIRETEAAYDQRRRRDPERLAAERERNRKRRGYINDWLRGYTRVQPGAIVEQVRAKTVFERDGYRCQLCGVKATGKFPSPNAPTVDHIVPLSRGGDHTYQNVQCACYSCNCAKGNKAMNDQLRLA